jgi:hypothetical protein
MTSASLCPLMRLSLSLMPLINRMGMILLCFDLLIVAELELMVHCYFLQYV